MEACSALCWNKLTGGGSKFFELMKEVEVEASLVFHNL